MIFYQKSELPVSLLRARLRTAEAFIRDRSAAAEANWSNISGSNDNSSSVSRHNSSVVGKILSVLEELDRFLFDKNDPNSNCLDALATRIWGPLNAPGQGLTTEVQLLGVDRDVVMLKQVVLTLWQERVIILESSIFCSHMLLCKG